MTPWPRDEEGDGRRAAERGEDEELPGLEASSDASGCSRTLRRLRAEPAWRRQSRFRSSSSRRSSSAGSGGAGASRRRVVGCRDQRTAAKPIATAPRRADQIREQPGQAVEALVERRAEHLLAAVLRRRTRWMISSCDLALVDERRQLGRASRATSRTDPCGTRRWLTWPQRRRCRRSRAAASSRTALRA